RVEESPGGIRVGRPDLALPAGGDVGGAVRMSGAGTSMKPGTSMKEARAALEASRGRVLATVADAETTLPQPAGARVGAAGTLAPAPRDPVRHLAARPASPR